MIRKQDALDYHAQGRRGKIEFGRGYIIPKPFDPRVLLWEAPAVARAAMETGVARHPIANMEVYKDSLEAPEILKAMQGTC